MLSTVPGAVLKMSTIRGAVPKMSTFRGAVTVMSTVRGAGPTMSTVQGGFGKMTTSPRGTSMLTTFRGIRGAHGGGAWTREVYQAKSGLHRRAAINPGLPAHGIGEPRDHG